MSPLEILFGIVSAIATLVGLGAFIHRRGIMRGREQQQLKAAGVRIAAIEDLSKQLSDLGGQTAEILIALRGSYGAPGIVARMGTLEGKMDGVIARLEALERGTHQ